jgi:hypothetical protein
MSQPRKQRIPITTQKIGIGRKPQNVINVMATGISPESAQHNYEECPDFETLPEKGTQAHLTLVAPKTLSLKTQRRCYQRNVRPLCSYQLRRE